MNYLQQSFSVQFQYKVFFSNHLFAQTNNDFRAFLQSQKSDVRKKLLFVLDEDVNDHHPDLQTQIRNYLISIEGFVLVEKITVIPGGESAKNNEQLVRTILDAINEHGIDRHSYLVAIGGGSILDLAGYAAAIAHRGIRHIRIPTTVLSQNDSGVGVKNGINYFNKKNFLGTFAPPVAVFNDSFFLTTLSTEDWRSGMSEAVKVALIKDIHFYRWLQDSAQGLRSRNLDDMNYLVKRCAELHLQHIAGGDPFEMGSARPLDFGHWSAHKLEQLSDFTIRHGEAVAMGIALDTAYSYLSGRISETDATEVVQLLLNLGFQITHPEMIINNEQSALLKGLNEFREHLGGKLTITLLNQIGEGVEVNELDTEMLKAAGKWLQQFS